ncbi:MAG: hypothetical protein P0120_14625 [Nitrospira sp.]|nr:hypothetical protein [Nitrospira sp.]
MNSLLTSLMFTRWVVFPWFGPNDFHNWAINSEFEIVRRQIMMGRPAMLGLWSMAGGPTAGHQVLCYGFETNPKKLYIYDPNRPDEECELVPVSPAVGVQAITTDSQTTYKTYRGYFFTDVYNWGERPPYAPPYLDLVVTQGIDLQPSGNTNVGGPLDMSVVVRNIGEYPAEFQQLYVWVRGPQGQNLDNLLGAGEPGLTRLDPGQQRLITRRAPSFGNVVGSYTIGVSYLSTQNEWINIPSGNMGAVAQRTITLWTQKTLIENRMVSVPESSAGVATGVTLQPGDEFELSGSGTVWAGVWFTGVNGPEGWMDRIESNPASPYINQPDAHPFSLVGRFGTEPFFYVGTGLSRRAYPHQNALPLILRTNDNAPGNGSGSFQCRIQVWR